MILQGDCRERMAEMEENSVDAIVCDPPYEIGFMNRGWDSNGIAYDQEVWRQAWRVLKPGGYLLAFGGTRTYHRLACAIEDAGFVLHPMIGWCFGSGFPKATNLSKMLDKAAGAEREIIAERYGVTTTFNVGAKETIKPRDPITAPATDAARQWNGWYYGKQSLKPALEPICMAQKPPEGRMVDNVLRWGCGAVNVDGCRIGTGDILSSGRHVQKNRTYPSGYKDTNRSEFVQNPSGRWPANLILEHAPGCVRRGEKRVKAITGGNNKALSSIYKMGMEKDAIATGEKCGYADSDGMETVADWDCVEGCAGRLIAEQSGHLKSGKKGEWEESEGTAARFFLNIDPDPLVYCAKVSQAERNRGLEGMSLVTTNQLNGMSRPIDKNHHPTVKPLKLMRYLVRLVTPPGGTVLDPFAGSGTTLIAAKEEGFRYIGIELEPEYIEIAEARLAAADRPPATLEGFE